MEPPVETAEMIGEEAETAVAGARYHPDVASLFGEMEPMEEGRAARYQFADGNAMTAVAWVLDSRRVLVTYQFDQAAKFSALTKLYEVTGEDPDIAVNLIAYVVDGQRLVDNAPFELLCSSDNDQAPLGVGGGGGGGGGGCSCDCWTPDPNCCVICNNTDWDCLLDGCGSCIPTCAGGVPWWPVLCLGCIVAFCATRLYVCCDGWYCDCC